jgi:hypothetical protein
MHNIPSQRDPKQILAQARAKFLGTEYARPPTVSQQPLRDPKQILAQARAKFAKADAASFKRQLARLELVVDQLRQEIDQLKAALTMQLRSPRAVQQPSMPAVRAQVEKMVESYMNVRGGDPDVVWRKLYQELENRHGYSVYQNADGAMNLLDVIERVGLMEEFYKIVRDTYF